MLGPQVAVLMGSKSDFEVMSAGLRILEQFEISREVRILSAHRTPEETRRYVQEAEKRGVQVFIAGAGFAAHLAGMIAAHTRLPVIGVPINSSPLQGMDALLSTVQMPAGIPVAAMAIGSTGAANAAVFAVQILSLTNGELKQKLQNYREKMRQEILALPLDVTQVSDL